MELGAMHDMLFGPRASVAERFPDQDGQDLYALIESHYRLADRKALPFSPSGDKLLRRHEQ
eukprot:1746295-Pyramimonas_sp.AAC.1